MPNTTTAKKNLRKSQKRKVVNSAEKSQIKTYKKTIIAKISEFCTTGADFNNIMEKISKYLGKIHSKSRKNQFTKISAANFESKIVSLIRKKIS